MDLNLIYKEILTEAIDQNKIIKAINEKRVLTIYYKADREEHEKTGWRKIEPFCCGINKFGNPVLRAWQTSGVSNSYPPGKADDHLTHIPGWRMFRMDKIVSLVTERINFTAPREKYNPEDKDMVTIYAAAKFDDNDGQSPDNIVNPVQPIKPIQRPIAPVKPQVQQPVPVQQKVVPQPIKQVPKPIIPPQPEIKKSVLPHMKKHNDTGNTKNWFDKLTDKFRHLINYRPGK